MKHFVREITLATLREMEFVDLSEKVQAVLTESGIQSGLLTVFTQHTTTAILLNEKEEGLQKDMALFLSHMAPAGKDYHHDKEPQDGCCNTHSHLQSLLLPASQVVPVVGGKLALGRWQTLFFVDLDGPRPVGRLTVQVIGL